MPNKLNRCIIIILITSLFAACDSLTLSENPPYVVTKPISVITEYPGYFKYAGILLNFFNTSGKVVDEITFFFVLFDAKTKENPFIGSNVFEISRLGIVSPNEIKDILISLDKYIYIAPEEPYIIDLFFISKIHYSDGSVWQDKNGIYRSQVIP